MGDIFNFLDAKSKSSAQRTHPALGMKTPPGLNVPPPTAFDPPVLDEDWHAPEAPPTSGYEGIIGLIGEKKRAEEAAKRKEEEIAPPPAPVTPYSLFRQCWRTTFVIWKLFWKTVWGLK